jgi:A/G-specific adenine glycosylase
VTANLGGRIPSELDRLLELPGIGRYTAAAIASIAFGRPHPVLDGNVARVCSRLWGIAEDLRAGPVLRALEGRLSEAIALSGDPASFNQAMMELGALVCRLRDPACPQCPLAQDCTALATGRTGELPRRRQRPRVPHYRIAVGLVEHHGRLLIARRREDQMLGGLWEFPGGKREAGERLRETVVREVREELALDVRVVRRLCTIQHAYSHFRITLTAFLCAPVGDPATARCDRPTAWVPWARLGEYPFPKANHKVLAAVQQLAKGEQVSIRQLLSTAVARGRRRPTAGHRGQGGH